MEDKKALNLASLWHRINVISSQRTPLSFQTPLGGVWVAKAKDLKVFGMWCCFSVWSLLRRCELGIYFGIGPLVPDASCLGTCSRQLSDNPGDPILLAALQCLLAKDSTSLPTGLVQPGSVNMVDLTKVMVYSNVSLHSIFPFEGLSLSFQHLFFFSSPV